MYEALIVDDDRAIRYILKKSELFQKHGFLVTEEAADGKEALEKVRQSHYDVILVDIKMPVINGIQFIEELRSTEHDVCVVIISGSTDFGYARQAIKLGAFDYLLKPIKDTDLDELLAKVKLHLKSKNIEKNASAQLVESLMLPYSHQDEQKLYELITHESSNCADYAREIFKRLFDFYEGDSFKISIILDNSLKKLMKLLLSEIPWLANVQLLDKNVHLQRLENISVLEDAYLSQIRELSDLIKKLHIYHPNSIVKRLCEYVTANVEQKITLETAALELNYSSRYLGKLFKESTGESIVNYITKVKMERAKNLLLSGKYKNYEVSQMLGYKNHDYFTKLFKMHHGSTPLACRKSSI